MRGCLRTTAQLLAKLHGFDDLATELMPYIETLDGYGRRLFGDARKFDLETAGAAIDFPEYHDSWFSIVADTEMRNWASRITEKVIKPLVNFHPMVVVGNPGALEIIRGYGFQTFDGWCDESYDQEPDPRTRFELTYREIRRLCALTDAELARLEGDIAERLIFNAKWGLTTFPTRYRAQYDADLINRVIAAVSEVAPK